MKRTRRTIYKALPLQSRVLLCSHKQVTLANKYCRHVAQYINVLVVWRRACLELGDALESEGLRRKPKSVQFLAFFVAGRLGHDSTEVLDHVDSRSAKLCESFEEAQYVVGRHAAVAKQIGKALGVFKGKGSALALVFETRGCQPEKGRVQEADTVNSRGSVACAASPMIRARSRS